MLVNLMGHEYQVSKMLFAIIKTANYKSPRMRSAYIVFRYSFAEFHQLLRVDLPSIIA